MKSKKIVSFLLALVMLVSVIGVVPAKAADAYSGSLVMEDSEIQRGQNVAVMRKCSQLYLKGDESLRSVPADTSWKTQYKAADDASGIFLDEVKMADAYIMKYNDENNWWFMTGWGESLTEGQTITIKGNFANGDVTIAFTKVSFIWDGSRFAPAKGAADKSGVDLKARGDGTAAGFYVNSTVNNEIINDGMEYNGDWSLIVTPKLAAYSGVLVNGVYYPVFMKKLDETTYYVDLAYQGVSATTDMVITIRGQFTYNGYVVDFNESEFVWDGSVWGEPQKEIEYQDITVDGMTSSFHDKFLRWNIFLTTDNAVPGVDFGAAFDPLSVTINGKAVSLPEGILRASENQIFTYIPQSILGQNITEDTTIVIKGGKLASAAQGVGINLTKDITIYANAYGWSLDGFIKAPESASLKFTGIDAASAYSSKRSAWHFYLQPTKSLPGIADQSRFWGVKVEYEGTEFEVHIDKSAHNDTGFVEIVDSLVPKNITKETTLTFKAGSYKDPETGSVMVLEEDFVLYGNEYGWAAGGYITKPKATSVTFTGINQATGFSERTQGWHIYLTPKKALPGVENETFYFPLVVEVNGKTEEQKLWKSGHEGTAFLEITTGILPKDITKNTKIVFKAGTAMGSDDKNAIELEKDFVIYANQYGLSLEGFLSVPSVKKSDKNVKLALDRNTVYGGNKSGIYLDTTDSFPVDKDWKTSIKAVSYDEESGIFYNGKKVDAILKRYHDGKAYLSLADAGITAKDKDKVTVKGMFALGEQGVIYKEVSFYFNGKVWNEGKYEKAKPATYTQITGISLNNVSGWSDTGKRWSIYINLQGNIPGEIDVTSFDYLQVEINGKTIETRVTHSYQDTLFVPIYAENLSKDAKDGTKIVIKAGKALAADMTTGIQFMKDFTLYTYKGTLSEVEPTDQTKWLRTALEGTQGAGYYNIDADKWYIFFEPKKDFATEKGTKYADLPLIINGKEYKFTAIQETNLLRVEIPTDIIPKDTMSNMKVELKVGATCYANAGRNGIEFTNGWIGYVYNRIIGEEEIEEIQDYEVNVVSVQNVTSTVNASGIRIHHVYVKTNKDFPGESWYEHYTDFVFYYNGKLITSELVKATCSDDKLIYFPIIEQYTGEAKEGDIITIKGGTVVSAGANKVTFGKDFEMIYSNGLWIEYVKTDAKVPEKTASLWEDFRFKEGYVPVQEEEGVMGTNESKFSTIYSTEMHKDYTMSFSMTKKYDDEVTPPMTVILRGTPVEEGGELDPTFLNGYVITFSAGEVELDNGEEIVQQSIHIWKNGRNDALVDLYRVHYTTIKVDHPFFQMDKTYDYDISIYNVTDTSVCIEVSVNGQMYVKYYDDAGSDPFDPAINEGTFALAYGCPSYLTDDIDTELTEVIAAAEECLVGEEVQFAVTYPFVLEGSEFFVEEEGATIENGVFVATKPGTYTVSGSYNGKELTAKTIVVKEAPVEETDEPAKGDFPVLSVAIAGGVVILALIVALIFLLTKKRRK